MPRSAVRYTIGFFTSPKPAPGGSGGTAGADIPGLGFATCNRRVGGGPWPVALVVLYILPSVVGGGGTPEPDPYPCEPDALACACGALPSADTGLRRRTLDVLGGLPREAAVAAAIMLEVAAGEPDTGP